MRFSHPLNREPAREQAALAGAHRSILVAVLCLYHILSRTAAAEDADLCYRTHVQMLINDTCTVVSPFTERLRDSRFIEDQNTHSCSHGSLVFFFLTQLRLPVSLNSSHRLDRDHSSRRLTRNCSMFTWSVEAFRQENLRVIAATSCWIVADGTALLWHWPTPSTQHLKWSSQDWHHLVELISLSNQGETPLTTVLLLAYTKLYCWASLRGSVDHRLWYNYSLRGLGTILGKSTEPDRTQWVRRRRIIRDGARG